MSENNMVFKVELGKHSAPGLNRPQNDDNVGYYLPPQPEVLHLRGQMFIIASGKSESQEGYIASKLVVETLLQEYYDAPWSGIPQEMIARAMEKANKRLFEYSVDQGESVRFTSSASCLVVINETAYIAHVGKSRIYMVSVDQTIEQLTQDQSGGGAPYQFSPFADPIEAPGEAGSTLGVDEKLNIEVTTRKVQINDILLLCSEGVHSSLQSAELAEVFASMNPQVASETVVNAALQFQSQQDATAFAVKLKSIRRMAGEDADEEEIEAIPEEEPPMPAERQIVIKGVRYRSTWKGDQLPDPETESVDEFDQDRDVRRPIVKRKSPGERLKLPGKNTLNLVTFVILIAAIIFLIIKYGPSLWQTSPPPPQSTSAPDTVSTIPATVPDTVIESQEIVPQPPVEQVEEPEMPAGENLVKEMPDVPLKVAVINGSNSRKINLKSVVKDLNVLGAEDRITSVRSTIKLANTKIIWRRTNDPARAAAIQKRVNLYKKLLLRNFQIEALTQPLDFTLVIGSDFKLPNLGDAAFQSTEGTAYYMEILNGSTKSGMAGKSSKLLDNRNFGSNTLHVIDFRNADKKNYRATFVKCDVSQKEVAGQLTNAMKLPNNIVNEPLFDVKLLLGADIDRANK